MPIAFPANYRANIYALKNATKTHCQRQCPWAVYKKNRTWYSQVFAQLLIRNNIMSVPVLFGKTGVVGHVSFAEPYCLNYKNLFVLVKKKSCNHFEALVCIEGLVFSSFAESHYFRTKEAVIIGMTAMPEAVLAAQAEIPYATLAFVTDYDCWKEEERTSYC